VRAGEVTAFVEGSRSVPYRVRLGVRRFTDDEWDGVVAAIAARAGHAAALLDGELDPAVAADVRGTGVDLLPGPGDLDPRCSCPDDADPCKHAAAVAYLVADALDADPFALFALRGRARDRLVADVRSRRRGASPGGPDAGAAPDDADPGVPARQAWAAVPGPRPPLPTPPEVPGRPAPWPSDPPLGAPFSGDGLDVLAVDAAERAWAQLRGEGDSGLRLDARADLARRAAAVLGDVPRFSALARAARASVADLERRARAWHHGGAAGLAVLDQPGWRPPVAVMAEGRRLVADAVGPGVTLFVRDDRILAGRILLRYAPDGRWWRMEKHRGRWEVAAPPAEAPDDLV
jgi:hypothetical protein